MNNNKANNTKAGPERINFREVIRYYLRYWPWIFVSAALFVTATYLYLSAQPKIYKSEANVLVKDSKKGDLASELDIFSDLGLSGNQSNLHNEIEILSSRPLIQSVVQSLNLNVDIYQQRGLLKPDRHFYNGKQPVKIDLSRADSSMYEKGVLLKLNLLGNEKFALYNVSEEKENEIGKFSLGDPIQTPIGEISVKKNAKNPGGHLTGEYFVAVNSIKSATSNYKSSLSVSPVNKEATVLKLSITGETPQRNEEFLNALIEEHENQAIIDKNKITKHTSEFIAERMEVIESELSSVESRGEDFKTKNDLVNVELDAERYMEKEGSIETLITQTVIESNLVDFMNDYLSEHDQLNFLLPANLGFTDESINTMTAEFNRLVLQRNKIVESASAENPYAVKLENQIRDVRESLKNSLKNLKKSLNIRLEELRQKERQYQQKLDNIPEYERRYREIARQQQIKETLYLYLLQKREENEIAMASTVGNVKVVENAFTSNTPIAPQRRSALLGALFLGILLPVGILYARDKLDNKIHSREDLDDTKIPVLAEIPKTKDKRYLVVNKGERSLIAEAFGMLRNNMSFLLPKNTLGGNVIFISSAIAGEGKTFIAINFANSLALIDKKIVLVGMDLRAPKITRYLDIEDGKGVSNYLANEDLTLDDITVRSKEQENLDYIISGDVPPNPSELLMRPRIDEFFEELRKKYDYIIVDNAPTTLVVDAMAIVRHSDLFLYVVRANYLDKKLLDDIRTMKEEEKVKNLGFILNDIDLKHGPYRGYGYGYGYGYGSNYIYGQEKKSRFRNPFRK
ncbi:MAG: polysaccharide biosynthesis tyrosine autokinase [Brumimicrobium sp.]|nr:polysaccharide biosynthesis tyrosine autokinase [Brumimicrobium sp.]